MSTWQPNRLVARFRQMTHPSLSVLLDLDGTLIDSKPGIVASYHAALRDLGHAPDPTIDLTFVIGPAIEDVIGEVLEPYGETRVAAAVEAYRHRYGEIGVYGVTPYPGIADLLAALKAAGHRIVLATSKRRVFAERILAHLGFARLFDGIYGSEPGGARDHKPELIAHILAERRIAPAAAVMVGDRRFDVAGAHANGVRAIGVLWGYGERDELERAGADLVVGSPEELTTALVPDGAGVPTPAMVR